MQKELVLDATANQMEVDDLSPPELSVTAQVLFDQAIQKLKQMLYEMTMEHRQIHSAISKCGKDMDRNFQADLNGLIKNEKNLEQNPENLMKANSLIFDHLVSSGMCEVAESFIKECELPFNSPKYDMELMKKIMEPLRQRDVRPAIDWVKLNAPNQFPLLFKLHRQYIIQLLYEGKRLEALHYSRELQSYGEMYANEISTLMAAVVLWPNTDRYQELFHPNVWQHLEEDLANFISKVASPLPNLINTGARAIPSLLTLKNIMVKRQDHLFNSDELPIEVPIINHVHSAFTCPILKIQSTDNNPPMRLNCGHCISKEALQKLIFNTRHHRLKCPYCPEESSAQDAKRVHF
uniref:Uncharacterized protein n=1 Tax=Acrobeloides nanus TaxID=290746 RepID=A0A914C887_9BILA